MRQVKGRVLPAAVGVMAMFAASVAIAQEAADLEQEVRDTVEQLTATYAANDIDGYFALYAPELTWWGGERKMGQRLLPGVLDPSTSNLPAALPRQRTPAGGASPGLARVTDST